LLARRLKVARVSAAMGLFSGVAVTSFLTTVFSIYVVRQVPMMAALHAAASVQPIYLEAAAAGAAGALLGRPSADGVIWNRVLAWLIGMWAIADLVMVVVPHSTLRGAPLLGLAEVPDKPVAKALLVPVGLLLLLTARGLSRHRKPAYQLALGLLVSSAVLNVWKDLDYVAALIALVLALALFSRRQDFSSPADPGKRSLALVRLGTALVSTLVFGVVALWVNRSLADLAFSPLQGLVDTVKTLVGGTPTDARYLLGGFHTWFPWAVRLVAAGGVVWAAAPWLAPWRHRLSETDQRRSRAAEIVRRWGMDTLAPFALRHDKALFIFGSPAADPSGDAPVVLIAYRVVRGVALISGDPIGHPDHLGVALDAFERHARERGWKLAVLGVSEQCAPLYRSRGLRVLYHGDEAVIDLTEFSLEGGRMKAVRQAAARVERKGYEYEIAYAGELGPDVRDELREVERVWLRGRPRTGFAMELDDLFRVGGEDALFVIGRDPEGGVVGFLHLALCPAGGAISLSSMPRIPDTPNGFKSWLIVKAVEWGQQRGYG
ncbi:MAG TPA: DUF2156 domain-containing protein, partial [Acidimicrobiales bacterium]|nr:DUF2156 domain-containing protein [Acidimicrobiales bacterium]